MPRVAREIELGFPMHVTQRGNNRQNIFRDEEDKEFYMRSFMHYKRLAKVKLYGWCLMDNHVHFVIEPIRLNSLSKLFLHLNNRYVSYFNSKYGVSGRLFQGRYHSCILDENHFLEALRYVELNPYRAKMELVPGNYEWTSAHEHLKKRNKFFITPLPKRIGVDDWWDFLYPNDINENIWDRIRNVTYSTKEFKIEKLS